MTTEATLAEATASSTGAGTTRALGFILSGLIGTTAGGFTGSALQQTDPVIVKGIADIKTRLTVLEKTALHDFDDVEDDLEELDDKVEELEKQAAALSARLHRLENNR